MTSIKLYKVNQTSPFEDELEAIYMYLTFKLKEPNIAKKFVKKVLKTLYSLEYLPERYARISNFKNKNRNLRRIFIDNYVIVYEVLNHKCEVVVLHIFHSTQNYFNLL